MCLCATSAPVISVKTSEAPNYFPTFKHKKKNKNKIRNNKCNKDLNSKFFEHFSGGRYIVTVVQDKMQELQQRQQNKNKKVIVTIYGITHCIHLLQRYQEKTE